MDVIEFIERDLKRSEKHSPAIAWVKFALALALPPALPPALGLGWRDDLVGVFDPATLFPHLAATLALALALAWALRLGSAPRSRLTAAWLSIGVALIFACQRLWLASWTTHASPTLYASSEVFWHENLRCFTKGVAASALYGAWTAVSALTWAPLPSLRWRALLAALAGASGVTALAFHCDSSSLGHVLIAHLGQGVLVGTSLFALLGTVFRVQLRRSLPELTARIQNLHKLG